MIPIPVIDLAAGQVVHAKGGNRNLYPPLKSQLCSSSKPVEVVAGLLALHPFTHLYIADLDAITGTGDHLPIINKLHRSFPGLQLWIDAGIHSHADYIQQRSRLPGTLVLGSETLQDVAQMATVFDSEDVVLSLDFRHGSALGSSGIETQPELWPRRIICMTLDSVGAGHGPDIEQLRRLQQISPESTIFAAGGVRNKIDLELLHSNDIDGVLLASALHNGNINSTQLRDFSG